MVKKMKYLFDHKAYQNKSPLVAMILGNEYGKIVNSFEKAVSHYGSVVNYLQKNQMQVPAILYLQLAIVHTLQLSNRLVSQSNKLRCYKVGIYYFNQYKQVRKSHNRSNKDIDEELMYNFSRLCCMLRLKVQANAIHD